MELFGLKIERKKREDEEQVNQNALKILSPADSEPAEEISGTGTGAGFFSHVYNDGSPTTSGAEKDLVLQYRTIAEYPDVDQAINEIVGEAICIEDDSSEIVKLVFDDWEGSDKIRERISESFDKVLRLLKFNSKAPEIFRRWYIDGRLYYYVVPNKEKTKIEQISQMSPLSIRKKREIFKRVDPKTRVEYIEKIREFYEYNPSENENNTRTGVIPQNRLELTADSVICVTSGLRDIRSKQTLSYLHKAIKPANNLITMEDSLVILRVARAPERRIFYIDVGNLQKGKAEEYMKGIMARHRNKITYDPKTGEVASEKNHQSILEDFWLPRREGRSGTEITTLPGASGLNEIDDVIYFQRKLYKALNVPVARLDSQQESMFSFGRASEISREEVKFQKFINRLRRNFGELLVEALKRVVLIEKILTASEFEELRDYITIDFISDNYFAELKQLEVLRERSNIISEVDMLVEKRMLSNTWLRKNILKQSKEDIEEIEADLKAESDDDDEGNDIDADDIKI
jgi:hypothetical protein